MFRVRDGDPVSGLAFTNEYSLVDSDGTQFGQAWSVEAIMAADTTTTTTAQSTVASWTNGDRTGRMGVIAVFLPGGQQASASVVDVEALSASGLAGGRASGGVFYSATSIIQHSSVIPRLAAMLLQTGGEITVTETWYYQFGGELVAMRKAIDGVDQGVTFLLSDHLGSTSVAYDPATGTATRQYYYPWGGLRGSDEPTVGTDIGYTGHRLDTSTELMYYNARYYDPAISRFISADTIVPNPGNPQDLNRYTYVRNNPILYNDPTGHVAEDDHDSVGDCLKVCVNGVV